MLNNYLLIGGSGTLGIELQKYLNCASPNSKELNITNENDIKKYNNINYKSIIHCAAYIDVGNCEVNHNKAILTNIIGTRNISTYLGYHRIVYISTDYVYPGITGNYKESDKTQPFNFYGFTKLAGEAFMKPEKDLIIRTSFKPNIKWPYPEAFNDLYTSADYVDIIAKDIAMLINSDEIGIINVGTERKTIYDLAFRKNKDVQKISKDEIKNVNLPSDISMNLEKLNNFKEKIKNGVNNVR